MSGRTGAQIGNAIVQWKKKNSLSSLFARIFSRIGGFVGGAMLIVAVIGLIVSESMKDGPNIGAMIGLALGGIAVDVGTHWIAMQIDKMLAKK